ncbi:MAG: hypothetical protein SWK90_18060 [Chloroflexota bacterium]|nr:hypothetical protein [Chloroflexota bacterium]
MKTPRLVLVLVLLVTLGQARRPSIASGDAPETEAATSMSMAVRQIGDDEGAILFQEYFDDTDFTSRGWYDNTNLQLSTTEHIPGSASSVEFHFNQGGTTPTSGSAIRIKFPETAEIYVSYHVKYSSNWEGSNRGYHPHEFLILTNLDSDWIGPAYTHMTAYIEQNEGEPLLAIQDGQNIDESNIGVDLTHITEIRAVAGCNGDSDGYGEGSCYLAGSAHRNGKGWRAGDVYFADTPGPYYKNDWHFVEAYFKLNSISGGTGIADGIMRYWYDGQLIIDHDDVVLRTGQHSGMKFDQFMIAPWIGDGSPVDQTFWVDDLTVATSRPTAESDLVLSGTPADQAIRLNWTVSGDLPVTSTWQINYRSQTGTAYLPVTATNSIRAHTLTGLTNYTWYTVTLNGMLGSTPFLTDTVRMRPTDIFVYLPLALKGP